MISVFAEFERAMIHANRLAPMTLGNRLAVGVQRLFVSWLNQPVGMTRCSTCPAIRPHRCRRSTSHEVRHAGRMPTDQAGDGR
jgi:hypothetical protein